MDGTTGKGDLSVVTLRRDNYLFPKGLCKIYTVFPLQEKFYEYIEMRIILLFQALKFQRGGKIHGRY